MLLNTSLINNIIQQGLDEDLGILGDVTSDFIIPHDQKIEFQISNREPIVLCGLEIALQIFKTTEERLKTTPAILKSNHKDGDYLPQNSIIIEGIGNARAVFAAERLVLNLMQHLSGISTTTKKYVDEIAGTNAQILDTRKTIPNIRELQKYAVKTGGGTNHRMALYDGILIKDNHISAAGNISEAVKLVRENLAKTNKSMPIEVECDTLDQVLEALESKADIIMLDNMNISQTKKAVELIAGKAKIEASGGINLSSIKEIAQTGVNYISIGALTHSSKAVDIGLDVLK
ncbi:MAG: nicotinate-nucleotide pyrophosphorylase (carboxylating) [Rickettsiales bacterium]|jgi:nicotinate-nucleotide pyrophosphorylase (carboxylating)